MGNRWTNTSCMTPCLRRSYRHPPHLATDSYSTVGMDGNRIHTEVKCWRDLSPDKNSPSVYSVEQLFASLRSDRCRFDSILLPLLSAESIRSTSAFRHAERRLDNRKSSHYDENQTLPRRSERNEYLVSITEPALTKFGS